MNKVKIKVKCPKCSHKQKTSKKDGESVICSVCLTKYKIDDMNTVNYMLHKINIYK